MKKLMIAAAAAAMIVGVQAAECVKVTVKDPCDGTKVTEVVGATAYKVAISLKTTDFKQKNLKTDCGTDCYYWREQATKKIDGAIWAYLGCDGCEVCDVFNGDIDYDSAFWTKKAPIDWEFSIGLGRIGKKGTDVEAYGGFGNLAWAGFGKLNEKSKNGGACGAGTCTANVKSITGGIAGMLDIDIYNPELADDPCDCGVACDELVYEECCEIGTLAQTAAYGTIKISYDKSTAKKIAKLGFAEEQGGDAVELKDFLKIPSAIADEVEAGEVTIEE